MNLPSNIRKKSKCFVNLLLFTTYIKNSLCYLLLLFCFGCATRAQLLPKTVSIEKPSELLQVLSSQEKGLEDLKAQAKVSLQIDGVREKSASAYFLYRSPRDLKLAIGALGIEIMSALSQNDTLALYLPRNNRYIEGPSSEVLYRLTGVNLEYYDVQCALLGLSGLSPLDLTQVTKFEIQKNRFFLEIWTPLWDRQIWFDRATVALLEEHISDRQGKRLSSRRLSDYREKNGVILPKKVEIFQGENHIKIQFSRQKINSGISIDQFKIRVPSDFVPIEIPSSF